MNGQRGLLLWVLGFGGSMLLYSAFTNKSPLDVFTTGVEKTGTKSGVPTPVPPGPGAANRNHENPIVEVPKSDQKSPRVTFPMGA